MTGIALALEMRVWNRLMGLFAHGTPTIRQVEELVMSRPTFVTLSRTEAGFIRTAAMQALAAAKEWESGKRLDQLDIPKLPIPSLPSLDGGPDGKFQVSLLGDNEDGTFQPIQFSTNQPLRVTDVVEALDNYRVSLGDDSPGLKNYLVELAEDLLAAKPSAIVPWWLLERIGVA